MASRPPAYAPTAPTIINVNGVMAPAVRSKNQPAKEQADSFVNQTRPPPRNTYARRYSANNARTDNIARQMFGPRRSPSLDLENGQQRYAELEPSWRRMKGRHEASQRFGGALLVVILVICLILALWTQVQHPWSGWQGHDTTITMGYYNVTDGLSLLLIEGS